MKKNKPYIFLEKRSLLIIAVFLFVFSVIYHQYFLRKSTLSREKELVENHLHQQQKDFLTVLKDTQLLQKLVQETESLAEFQKVSQKDYGIFIYAETIFEDYEMLFWNTQLVVPQKVSFHSPDGEYFQHLSNGDYLTIKKTISLPGMTNRLQVYAMMPVRFQYFIETDYMRQRFAYNNEEDENLQITQRETRFPVQTLEGKNIFYLDQRAGGTDSIHDNISTAFRISAFILLLMYIHFSAERMAGRRSAWKAVGLLSASLIMFRLILYIFPAILNLRQFELFDPTIYGSNMILRSLGDLLLNALLFCWIVLFAWSKLGNSPPGNIYQRKWKWVIGIGALFFLILATFTLASVIRSLIADSKISFDVTNFFSLNIYSVVGFVVLASLSLGYYYFTQLLFHFIFPVFEKNEVFIYFAMAVTGLLYLTIRAGDPRLQFYVPVLFWLIIYTWLVSQKGFVINRFRVNIAGILFWIFVFSLSISIVILTQNKTKEWQTRKAMAEKIALENDPANEKQISIALTYLDNDYFVNNFKRFEQEGTNQSLRDSILNFSYSGYSARYKTKIYVFDEQHNPLYNEDPISYEALNNILKVQSRPTNTPDLHYYETSFEQFTYITQRQVIDTATNRVLGSIFIISTPKNYGADALSPELFRQMKPTDPESSPIYSVAVYNKKSLVSPSNKYPFPTYLNDNEIPRLEFSEKINGSYDELWYRGGNDKIVIVARKTNSVIETITLFSYIFCAFLFMVSIFKLASLILRALSDRRQLPSLWQMNIRTQVHSTIIFVSILSFLIIGIATISFFIIRYNRNNSEKLSKTMRIMVNEMQEKVSQYGSLDDVVKMYDSVSNDDLQSLIEQVAQIHDVDVNLYNREGNLVLTSTDNIYRKGVLSTKMNPEAYYHLDRLRQIRHIQEEHVAALTYLSIYAPVRNENGDVLAYLNIPYFTSLRDLNQEISNFLVTIINLNAFIFLISGVIALFITNRITRSFSVISEKMQEVNLGQTNEEIIWNRDDEIGVLVKEYNKMVTKLEDSAQALAKSEREGAWREMARQVAHEIKNPLTPMKLSIQYLQKAVDNNQDNVKELTGRVAGTLVEQIDHLSKIAADFAQFANIGNTKIETLDLHDVISSLKDLYKTNPDVHISWNPLPGKALVKADKTQMNRLFTNLLSNAVDACQAKDLCKIVITESLNNGMTEISVADNGEGIPEEMQHKIFTPNFTTKSSGTGLGLAMCKSIVEQSHGKIWFETETGKGTLFHVALPRG